MNATTVSSSSSANDAGRIRRAVTSELGQQDTICYVYPDGRVVITHRKPARAR